MKMRDMLEANKLIHKADKESKDKEEEETDNKINKIQMLLIPISQIPDKEIAEVDNKEVINSMSSSNNK